MYQVVQRNPNIWYQSGEHEMMSREQINRQDVTDDLQLAAIACDARNALDCNANGRPMYHVESDDPADWAREDSGQSGWQDVDSRLVDIEAQDVYVYMIDVLKVDPATAERAVN